MLKAREKRNGENIAAKERTVLSKVLLTKPKIYLINCCISVWIMCIAVLHY